MSLIERVHIARRFQRSVRIDTDLGNPESVKGFICPQSSADLLLSMAHHVAETRHGAFTWTGPYGSGKSSLVVALSALLNGNKGLRDQAAKTVGKKVAEEVWEKLPPRSKGWRVLGVVGRRDDPVQVIGEAIDDSEYAHGKKKRWSETRLIETLSEIASAKARSHGGLVVFVDEMGKFLEGAAHGDGDIFVFQQLAEAASRSGGRLIVVGVLHQAFEEYANRLSREFRDEWSKIQGRFIDLPINTVGEEQIDLVSRAIEGSGKSAQQEKLAAVVGQHIRDRRSGVSAHVTDALTRCWPLHPVTAALLGPISRRRFGQNQRSIFGFLNSAEPHGFQDFLRHAGDDDLYEPTQLWDYLRTNIEPSILAAPDGHRWALAAEAVERCDAIGGDALHIQLLKTIALIDLFKDRSGIVPSDDLLQACMPTHTKKSVRNALAQLKSWSLVVFKKFLDAYAVYAGSDFDIDEAVETVLEESKEFDFTALRDFAGLQPILAKRHYHEYGALRWFDVEIAPLGQIVECAAAFEPGASTIGQFLLAIPTANESAEKATRLCREAARLSDQWDIVVGLSHRSWFITELAREHLALERVRNERSELQGDDVARREVRARLATLQSQLEAELHRAFDNAEWFQKHRAPKHLLQNELNSLASGLADLRYPKTPRLHNELLIRIKPSGSAISAQNFLLRHMVVDEGRPRLGIKGFPAQGGLFASILEATGLYAETEDEWRFVIPGAAEDDPACLAPIWNATCAYLQDREDRSISLSEIYELWRAPPFGMKDGVMPVIAVAYVLSNRNAVALYRQGIFQARFKDLDVEYLANDPNDIQLRWMNLSEVSRRLLSGMAEIVRDLDTANTLENLEPIDVGRGLIAIYDDLQPWTKRTMRLSSNALHIRGILKKANDPNRLLFNDLPALVGNDHDLSTDAGLVAVVDNVREGLAEMVAAYPAMLHRFADNMLAELQVPNTSAQALADLRDRAENIRELAGDFRLNAFVGRVAAFSGATEDIEGLASLAADKPPIDWIDSDLDRAAVEITELAQRFNKSEAYARVKGRPDKRHAMAVVVGMGGRPAPVIEEFDIMDADRATVDEIIERVEVALDVGNQDQRNVILAALAEITARYMNVKPQAAKRAPSKSRATS